MPEGTSVDFPGLMERMRRLRAGISPHDSAARFRDAGIDVFIGSGRFVDGQSIDVGGKTLNFKKAVVYSPDFYDSYYGMGLHKYWLSAKSKILRALPFARDNRKQGIKYVKIAMEKGQFTRPMRDASGFHIFKIVDLQT